MRRIICGLQGISDREGLFEIIAKSQNHYQKRAYQIIKILVQLFTSCEPAIDLLNKDDDLKRKWNYSRNWFFNEMEKCRMYNMPNYTYFQTPQSNETSQTYFLERTQSARLTLEKALRILPQNMTGQGPLYNPATIGENNDDQIENDEEEAYESISDEDNLEFRSKANKENIN
jgi:ubiquitin carboxyl-terminal hydrolase 9/24